MNSLSYPESEYRKAGRSKATWKIPDLAVEVAKAKAVPLP